MESNLSTYMVVMDELSEALGDYDVGKLLLEVARMLVAEATRQVGTCPLRLGDVCRAMLVVERLNAQCVGGGTRVSRGLFLRWLKAEGALIEQPAEGVIVGEKLRAYMLISAAHQLVDIALDTCSDNPNHVRILASRLAYLDPGVEVAPESAA